jgi:hypothetical protein
MKLTITLKLDLFQEEWEQLLTLTEVQRTEVASDGLRRALYALQEREDARDELEKAELKKLFDRAL